MYRPTSFFGVDTMPRYVVPYAVTEDSVLGEESHFSTAISGAFAHAERRPDGVWIIQSDMTANAILEELSEGAQKRA